MCWCLTSVITKPDVAANKSLAFLNLVKGLEKSEKSLFYQISVIGCLKITRNIIVFTIESWHLFKTRSMLCELLPLKTNYWVVARYQLKLNTIANEVLDWFWYKTYWENVNLMVQLSIFKYEKQANTNLKSFWRCIGGVNNHGQPCCGYHDWPNFCSTVYPETKYIFYLAFNFHQCQ